MTKEEREIRLFVQDSINLGKELIEQTRAALLQTGVGPTLMEGQLALAFLYAAADAQVALGNREGDPHFVGMLARLIDGIRSGQLTVEPDIEPHAGN